MGYGLALALGITLPHSLPSIVPWPVSLLLAIALAVVARNTRKTIFCWGCLFLLGISWSAWRIDHRLAQQLPPAWEGRTIELVGQVVGLPQMTRYGWRVELEVENVLTVDPTLRVPSRLTLFDGRQQLPPRLIVGSHWQMQVRLKRMHSVVNPYGRELESSLWANAQLVSGQIRRAVPLSPRFSEQWSIDHWRDRIRQHIAQQLPNQRYAGLVSALVIGDQQAIPAEQWQLFQRTGLIHLISISGVHLTLAAAGVAWITAWLLRVCAVQTAHRPIIAVAALLFAAVYALLAGFSVPTQRSFYMLVAVTWALSRREPWPLPKILLFAALAVLIPDPFAVLTLGFWLSFGTVAAMALAVVGYVRRPSAWRLWLEAQWGATVLTLLPVLVLFQTISWVAPFANAYAIPLIGGFATGLLLFATVLPVSWALPVAHQVLVGVLWPVEYMGQWPQWVMAVPEPLSLLAALLGCGLLLVPFGVGGRGFAVLLLLPLFFASSPRPALNEVWLTVLDVGQGLAVWIQTARHSLLYDTGPRLGERDMGERVVVPQLHAAGVTQLDALILSHDDLDHVGGTAAVVAALPVQQWLAPYRLASATHLAAPFIPCRQGMVWQWDGVEFAFLHPVVGEAQRDDNGQSCVLRVRTGSQAMLLTGDITAAEEAQLVQQQPDLLRSQVLLAAHHGSRTSSSLAFLNTVAPEQVIVSVGYRNAFRHPQPQVWERFLWMAQQRWRTDRDGAIRVHLTPNQTHIQAQRTEARRYWYATSAGSGD